MGMKVVSNFSFNSKVSVALSPDYFKTHPSVWKCWAGYKPTSGALVYGFTHCYPTSPVGPGSVASLCTLGSWLTVFRQLGKERPFVLGSLPTAPLPQEEDHVWHPGLPASRDD